MGGVFLHRGWWQDRVERTRAWTSKTNPGPNSDEKGEGDVDVTAIWSRHIAQTEGRWVLIGFFCLLNVEFAVGVDGEDPLSGARTEIWVEAGDGQGCSRGRACGASVYRSLADLL